MEDAGKSKSVAWEAEAPGGGHDVGIIPASDATPDGSAAEASSQNLELSGSQPDEVKRNLSMSEPLSVRTDWSSESESSPRRTKQLDASNTDASWPASIPQSRGHRTRTLTATISPRVPLLGAVRYGVHSIQNRRSEMEDAHKAVLGAEGSSPSTRGEDTEPSLGNFSYFAVFDGHGGARAAEFGSQRLFSLLAENREELCTEPESALAKAFAQTEADWLTLAKQDELMDGTTAAVVVVDRVACCCVVGNVGDSEVIMGGRSSTGETMVKTLTEVHHLKRSASEAKRVEDVGGRVWKGRLGHPKISPQVLSLSVSRALGDLFFKDERFTGGLVSGLTADPYITSAEVCSGSVKDEFILIGCDGLWDTVTYEEAANLVLSKLAEGEEPQAISEALVRMARDAGSMDNITVMVVAF
eukprot:TRINITY_DN25176_c0_g1_i1.p1 TRINITY_DN25176_c0_g1~~TRINITY_DN25176_c0_g1_i1.p1  ORF type:complete len:414 (+),score=77.64 TRINITY_DN25176_c0_g1_i1:123-1364(+)